MQRCEDECTGEVNHGMEGERERETRRLRIRPLDGRPVQLSGIVLANQAAARIYMRFTAFRLPQTPSYLLLPCNAPRSLVHQRDATKTFLSRGHAFDKFFLLLEIDDRDLFFFFRTRSSPLY